MWSRGWTDGHFLLRALVCVYLITWLIYIESYHVDGQTDIFHIILLPYLKMWVLRYAPDNNNYQKDNKFNKSRFDKLKSDKKIINNCFNCRKPGHLVKNCYKKKNSSLQNVEEHDIISNNHIELKKFQAKEELHLELFRGVLVHYKYETFVKLIRMVCSSTLLP